jgi:DNA-damage-inducible protein D
MENTITGFSEAMKRLRRVVQKDGNEIEFWSAREIHSEVGYEKWENFIEIIEKGIENCSKIKVTPENHFAEVRKMVPIGSGAFREQTDYVLSRTACYLIALNGDARKEQIAWAKAYFVVQTQLQEARRNRITDAEERFELREKLKQANKQLGGVAKEVGVKNYGYFHAAGIRGLYGMAMSDLKSRKGIPEKEDYWDRVCGLELSANEFKAQLAKKTIEQKKKRGELHGQLHAEKEHQRVGQTVRATIHKETGIHLENLPAEPSLRKLLSESKKSAKLLRTKNIDPSR